MYTVSSDIYIDLAARLADAISDKGFFSGSITTAAGDIRLRLTTTLVIYRERPAEGTGTAGRICDAVPVWWEFHAACGGEELLNDFSFERLRETMF